MPSGNDAFVGLPPDAGATGKKLRNIQLDVPQADGSIATVLMQVINIRDASGEVLATSDRDVLKAIYDEIRALRTMYGRATGLGFAGLPAQTDDFSDIG